VECYRIKYVSDNIDQNIDQSVHLILVFVLISLKLISVSMNWSISDYN